VAVIGHELRHVVEALDGLGADTMGSSANVLEIEAARDRCHTAEQSAGRAISRTPLNELWRREPPAF